MYRVLRPNSFRGRLLRKAFVLICLVLGAFFFATLAWLWLAVPVAKSADPMVPGQLVLVARDGTFIAEDGYLMDTPVELAKLPPHVAQAFYAIEDRRFPNHVGFDPIGIARALINNLTGGARQGGSTITQQLAKNAYLRDPATGAPYPGYTRKFREIAIAVWLEAWLTKDQILERYLSMVPFGKRVYGLRAASLFYFHRQPEKLTVSQAVMLAGLVQAPSRYDPSVKDVELSRKRALKVALAMQAEGYLPPGPQSLPAPAQLDIRQRRRPRTGFYFADWVMDDARAQVGRSYAQQVVTTTLDAKLQSAAQELVRTAPYPDTDIALVALRPNGEVVAMIGGRDYARSQFNIAVDARRQPGSTFKLFTYVAALQRGKRPGSVVSDAPLTSGDYRPANSDGLYAGDITLLEAFARSSNVAAVRLFDELGADRVVDTARAFGFEGAVTMDPSLALGTSETSLLSLTAAYAGVAAGKVAITPFGLPQNEPGKATELVSLDRRVVGDIRAMLAAVIASGTGKAAQLPVTAYGKTGTTQNNRDAWFIGYAGELVVGVWIGNDSGAANPAISGGDAAARLWRDFMLRAIAADKLSWPRGPDAAGEKARTGPDITRGSGNGRLVRPSGLRGDDGRPATYAPNATGPAPGRRGAATGTGPTGPGTPPPTGRPAEAGVGIIFDGEATPSAIRQRPADGSAISRSPVRPQGAAGIPPNPRTRAAVGQDQPRRSRPTGSGDEDEDFTIDCGDDTC